MASQNTDILLIGGGVMSVTLASLISQLDGSRSITLVEQAGQLGDESSEAWNNAGTGHQKTPVRETVVAKQKLNQRLK